MESPKNSFLCPPKKTHFSCSYMGMCAFSASTIHFNGWKIGETPIDASTVWNYNTDQTAMAQWIVDTPTEVQTQLSSTLQLYPNPASTYISVSGICTTTAQLSIIDLSGRTVRTQQVSDGEKISVSDLAPGIYIVKMDGKTEKVVISR